MTKYLQKCFHSLSSKPLAKFLKTYKIINNFAVCQNDDGKLAQLEAKQQGIIIKKC